MATQDTPLAGAMQALLDNLAQYREALSDIRRELERVGEIDVDPRVVRGATEHTRDLLDALQPLEMQLAAVARQQETLRTFAGIRVDFDAFGEVGRTARIMDETVVPLRNKLAEFEKADGLHGIGDIDRQLELVERTIDRLGAFAEAEATLQAELDALDAPLRAHREAVLALQSQLESAVRARHAYGQSYSALRAELRALDDDRGGGAAPQGGDLSGLTTLVERFEQARKAQLDALDQLGFAGLHGRLSEFETARADQFPDFRNHRLDGLKAGVDRFDEVQQRHREALQRIELGDLENNLGALYRARHKQFAELEQLGLGVVLNQLFAIEQARGQQHNALSALSLGELERRFMQTIDRITEISRQIAAADLSDPSTAPAVDEDEVF